MWVRFPPSAFFYDFIISYFIICVSNHRIGLSSVVPSSNIRAPGVNGEQPISRKRRALTRGSARRAALVSFFLGIALGLGYTWGWLPIEFKNADLADLRQSSKDELVRMVSLAYETDGNGVVAQRRLAQLELSNPAQTFNDLIERETRNATSLATTDALIHLGQALGYHLPYTARRPAPGPKGTPTTILVIATPMASVPTFALIENTPLTCADEPDGARLRLFVRDAAGRDLPNIALEIRGADVSETVYTGLKPERGIGYADYDAMPGRYAVTILNANSDTAANLVIGQAPANCKNDKGATPRGWKLVFQKR